MKKIKNVLMILPLLFLSTQTKAFETNTDVSQLRNLDEATDLDSDLFQKDGKVYKKDAKNYTCELKKSVKNKKIEEENKKLFKTLKQEYDILKKTEFLNASDINNKMRTFLETHNKIIENAFCKSVYSITIKEQKEMIVFVYNKAINASGAFIENLENKQHKDFKKTKLFNKVYKTAIFKFSQQMNFLLKNLQ